MMAWFIVTETILVLAAFIFAPILIKRLKEEGKK